MHRAPQNAPRPFRHRWPNASSCRGGYRGLEAKAGIGLAPFLDQMMQAGRQAAAAGAALVLFLLGAALPAHGATVTLKPAKDNTLYESDFGSFSNGRGQYFFAGKTAIGDLRRALIAFDLAGSVPPGSTITCASLTLDMNMTISGQKPVSLHRATASWGEGPSDAFGQEGNGAPSAPSDATWIHRFYDTIYWVTPGGDFDPTASATTLVDQIGHYTWSSPAMRADIQGWVDTPASNFGWAVLGDESDVATAKRFASRDNPNAFSWPVLAITYTTLPAAVPAGHVPDGNARPGTMLTLQNAGAAITLAWGPSCTATDTDHEIYEGQIGSFASHTPFLCSTAGATTATITPSGGDRYYLVVPRSASREGSYGLDSALLERPTGACVCLPQSLAACP